MSWVTKDQIARARAVKVLDYVLAHERDNIKHVGSGYRMKDHPSLSVDSNGWYWHSRNIGNKSALSYLTDARGYNLVDAVFLLLNERPQERPDKPITKPPAQKVTPKALFPNENRLSSRRATSTIPVSSPICKAAGLLNR